MYRAVGILLSDFRIDLTLRTKDLKGCFFQREGAETQSSCFKYRSLEQELCVSASNVLLTFRGC